VRNDSLTAPAFIPLDLKEETFQVTLAQAIAPTPDALLAAVMSKTAKLAGTVDDDVLPKLYAADASPASTGTGPAALLNTLIDARADVEKVGYRAPSCLLTNTAGLKKLSQFVSGYSILDQLLVAANANSLHRAEKIDTVNTKMRVVLLGRRQRIAQGYAPEASPGEEPVDLAVSVLPSLEVLGDTAAGLIELSIRIRYGTRIKDLDGLVAVKEP